MCHWSWCVQSCVGCVHLRVLTRSTDSVHRYGWGTCDRNWRRRGISPENPSGTVPNAFCFKWKGASSTGEGVHTSPDLQDQRTWVLPPSHHGPWGPWGVWMLALNMTSGVWILDMNMVVVVLLNDEILIPDPSFIYLCDSTEAKTGASTSLEVLWMETTQTATYTVYWSTHQNKNHTNIHVNTYTVSYTLACHHMCTCVYTYVHVCNLPKSAHTHTHTHSHSHSSSHRRTQIHWNTHMKSKSVMNIYRYYKKLLLWTSIDIMDWTYRMVTDQKDYCTHVNLYKLTGMYSKDPPKEEFHTICHSCWSPLIT